MLLSCALHEFLREVADEVSTRFLVNRFGMEPGADRDDGNT